MEVLKIIFLPFLHEGVLHCNAAGAFIAELKCMTQKCVYVSETNVYFCINRTPTSCLFQGNC